MLICWWALKELETLRVESKEIRNAGTVPAFHVLSLVLLWILWLLQCCDSSLCDITGMGDASYSPSCHWFSCSSLHRLSPSSPVTPLAEHWNKSDKALAGSPLVHRKHTLCIGWPPRESSVLCGIPPTALAASHLQVPYEFKQLPPSPFSKLQGTQYQRSILSSRGRSYSQHSFLKNKKQKHLSQILPPFNF